MNVEITITHGERFIEQVIEDGSHDPYGHLRIRVDESYLVGSEDTSVGVWMTTDLIRLLAQTEAIFANKKDVVSFDNGPSYLVAEPSESAETVNLTRCLLYSGVEDPEQRLPIEETFSVSKWAWTKELVRVAEAYLDELMKLNPDLQDNEYVQELDDEVEDARKRLESRNDA